jgi:hypothetical protein
MVSMDSASLGAAKKPVGAKKRAREWDTGADVLIGDSIAAVEGGTADKNDKKDAELTKDGTTKDVISTEVAGDAGVTLEQKQHKYRKRKSLQEQLQNRRQYLYRERRRNMEKQNSSYKMRKDTRDFYGKLEDEKIKKKLTEEQVYEQELEEFRRRKAEQSSEDDFDEEEEASDASDTATKEPQGTLNSPQPLQPRQSTNSASLVAYSDSESD